MNCVLCSIMPKFTVLTLVQKEKYASSKKQKKLVKYTAVNFQKTPNFPPFCLNFSHLHKSLYAKSASNNKTKKLNARLVISVFFFFVSKKINFQQFFFIRLTIFSHSKKWLTSSKNTRRWLASFSLSAQVEDWEFWE